MKFDDRPPAAGTLVQPGRRPGIVLERLTKAVFRAADGDLLGEGTPSQRLQPCGTSLNPSARWMIDPN